MGTLYQMAGAVGVDPNTLSLRELMWMYEGHCIEQWKHTASVMATTVNMLRDPNKTKGVNALDYHPYAIDVKQPQDDPSTWSPERQQFERELHRLEWEKLSRSK